MSGRPRRGLQRVIYSPEPESRKRVIETDAHTNSVPKKRGRPKAKNTPVSSEPPSVSEESPSFGNFPQEKEDIQKITPQRRGRRPHKNLNNLPVNIPTAVKTDIKLEEHSALEKEPSNEPNNNLVDASAQQLDDSSSLLSQNGSILQEKRVSLRANESVSNGNGTHTLSGSFSALSESVAETRLDITAEPVVPDVYPIFLDQRLFRGDDGVSIVAEQEYIGDESTEVEFMIHGKPHNAEKYAFTISRRSPKDFIARIVIKEPNKSDAGRYTLLIGGIPIVFDVSIDCSFERPFIIEKPKIGQNADGSVSFTFGIRSHTKKFQLHWAKDGRPLDLNSLHYDEKIEQLDEERHRIVLNIRELKKSRDSGSYTCEASNAYGKTTAKFKINFEGEVVLAVHAIDSYIAETKTKKSYIIVKLDFESTHPPVVNWIFRKAEPVELDKECRAPNPRYKITLKHVDGQRYHAKLSIKMQMEAAFEKFLIENFVLCPKQSSTPNANAEEVERVMIDFVRPHECCRRLDLLIELRKNIVEKELHEWTKASEFLFALKVIRIYNSVLKTSAPFLEQRICRYNNFIVSNFCDEHFIAIGMDKNEVMDLLQTTMINVQISDVNSTTSTFSRLEFFEWTFINFCISMDSAMYHVASKYLEMSCALAGVQIKFSGMLGKRTRYQEKSLPQLVLENNDVSAPQPFLKLNSTELPVNIENRDDTVLEKIVFDESESGNSLSAAQTACVLAAAWLRQCDDPVVELKFEIIEALLRSVEASKERGFMMTLGMFMIRSDAERTFTRRVERACQQMEYLVDLLDNRKECSHSEEELRERCTDLFIGCPEAIGIFESICDWKSVVEGYTVLNMKDKALNVLKTLHNSHPNDPYYVCLIGDIQRDTSILQSVVNMTGDKYPLARKALGMIALEAKDYRSAFDNLKRVYELSPLSLQAVYNYGVAALEIEEYRDAITAFHHCASVDPDNYKAWNNLAAGYVRTRQPARAAQVLKVNPDSERMWANLYEIAAELPNKKDSLWALRRLLELQPKQMPNLIPLKGIIITATSTDDQQLTLPVVDYRLLVECLNCLHEQFTLDPIFLRLMAHTQRPADNETDPKIFEQFIELMDLAEKREIKDSSKKPNFAELLRAIMDTYEVRRKYAKLTNKNEAALNKVTAYRIRPLLKRIETESAEKSADLLSAVEDATTLLAKLTV